jgi:hypothetical protein
LQLLFQELISIRQQQSIFQKIFVTIMVDVKTTYKECTKGWPCEEDCNTSLCYVNNIGDFRIVNTSRPRRTEPAKKLKGQKR